MGVKVPKTFKKALTTLQITQFVFGATYAFSHLFVAYQVPVSVPYIYHLGDVASSVSSDLSSAVSVATATATAGLGAWLKKAAFRAAGREGLAENVVNAQGQTFGIDSVHAANDFKAREEIRYRDELQWMNCLDTSGQVFAILLNCMYLAPLTWLFVRFFARAYSHRQARRRSSSLSDVARTARDSGIDAFKGISRSVGQTVDETEDLNESAVAEDAVPTPGQVMKKDAQNAIETSKKAAKDGQDSFENWVEKVADQKNKLTEDFKNKKEEARKEPSADDLADQMKDVADSVKKDEN
jgi:GNS1/SUR4 family